MILNYNFKRYSKRYILKQRLYSTWNETRIKEIIQLVKDTESFNIALTHKSYDKNNPKIQTYERLEFLGDSILQLYVSILLYKLYPEYSEGKLTDERSLLVNGKYLSSLSLKIKLYEYLKLGKGKSNVDFTSEILSKKCSKILTDIFEAFIAVLYIEKGHKLLCEFLTLTILDKPEFKDKFLNYNINNLKHDEVLINLFKFHNYKKKLQT